MELPTFSSEEKGILKDSIDFIGVNHYTTLYTKDCLYSNCVCNVSSCSPGSNRSIRGFALTTGEWNGVTIGDRTGLPRFFVVPQGMEDILQYLKKRYNNKQMYITENGYASPVNENDDYQDDVKRIHFHGSHLSYLARAIRNGADVRGYFIWSLIDNFEWANGYEIKFGIYHIDRKNGTLNRIPKLSANWFRDMLSNHNISFNSRDDGWIQSE